MNAEQARCTRRLIAARDPQRYDEDDMKVDNQITGNIDVLVRSHAAILRV